MALSKNDIVETVFERIGYKKKQSVEVVETLLEIMKASLEKGDAVLLSGFGKFSMKKKKERKGRNPATGKAMMLKDRKVVTFKSSQKLKDSINNRLGN